MSATVSISLYRRRTQVYHVTHLQIYRYRGLCEVYSTPADANRGPNRSEFRLAIRQFLPAGRQVERQPLMRAESSSTELRERSLSATFAMLAGRSSRSASGCERARP